MTSYKLIKNTNGEIQSIIRDDNACIPVCEGNRDYQQYLEDISNGVTTTDEIIPDPVATISLEEQIKVLQAELINIKLGV